MNSSMRFSEPRQHRLCVSCLKADRATGGISGCLDIRRKPLGQPARVVSCPLEAAADSADHAVGLVAAGDVIKTDVPAFWAGPQDHLAGEVALSAAPTYAALALRDNRLAGWRDIAKSLVEIGPELGHMLDDGVQVVAD